MKYILLLLMSVSGLNEVYSQTYDLPALLKESKLITHGKPVKPITDGDKKAVALNGMAWIKGATFSEGTIDVDLQGKDRFQKSFIGIAFHAVDTITYEAVYFRPFNFQATDPVRKIHAVQYMSLPEYTWDRLREENNGIYEKEVVPAPPATDWFHARIVVKAETISVYVNHSVTPSLTVKKLNSRTSGLIALWNEGLDGNFANLVITR